MRIQLFKNEKGLIHGADPKRIECDVKGTLQIGSAVVEVATDSIMPLLFNGSSGNYNATYTADGKIYQLERVSIKGGRISPPSQTLDEQKSTRRLRDENEQEYRFKPKSTGSFRYYRFEFIQMTAGTRLQWILYDNS